MGNDKVLHEVLMTSTPKLDYFLSKISGIHPKEGIYICHWVVLHHNDEELYFYTQVIGGANCHDRKVPANLMFR